jgi:uncharacterized Zn ribbon protein
MFFAFSLFLLMTKIIYIEDLQCLYCNDIVETEGEVFCCDGCYHEWHEENKDYKWDKEKQIYVIK